MLRDPIGRIGRVEGVGTRTVREDVEEQAAVVPQGGPQAAKQRAPVRYVLEHFDRDDAIETPVDMKIVHVADHDGHILQTAQDRLLCDVIALRPRIGDRDDLTGGKFLRHVERERPPAAAQLQNGLAVAQVGMRAGFGERGRLGLGQRHIRTLVEAAGIFHVRPERVAEEGRRQLVVLGVGFVRVSSDRHRLHGRNEAILLGLFEPPQTSVGARDEQFDAGTGRKVRERRAFRRAERHREKTHRFSSLVCLWATGLIRRPRPAGSARGGKNRTD